MNVQIIFGTASFGMDLTEFQDSPSVRSLLEELRNLGVSRLDSGARYPPLMPGRAEELIGESDDISGSFLIDTKVYADTKTDGSGELTSEAVERSILASLQRLQKPNGVNVLHIHRADSSTPLEEQVTAFYEQVKRGRCKAWGVSNVSPEMLEEMLRICEDKGLPKPNCYQGDYNLVTRGMETRLLPLLRSHGMKFNAFRPLAAGFLTGKLISNDYADTRFGDGNPLSPIMQRLFSAEDLHVAMMKFDEKLKSTNLRPVEVAIRWIAYHSALTGNDGIIIGASKAQQARETIAMINKGPLPREALELTEELWDAVKESRGNII